ncbi:NfeD family protein [uncultured Microscilla sp.]|uniref:NfeD family protein n=1 Tax=uncultured Microscilla sp. TaxID=432653 RepID=UPI002606E21B|nr:NfeD family protein [uncultured Microscilla sp.]
MKQLFAQNTYRLTRVLWWQAAFGIMCWLGVFGQLQAQDNVETGKTKVFVIKIRQEINPQVSRYVDIALEEALNLKADYIIVDMNTYGGRVDDADYIRTKLLDFKKPVWVFVNKNAASAGALISIACDKIYMQPGATIGAATVVTGDKGKAAPDKYQSYMRGMMRATAKTNKRDPRIAEAMVDQNIEIEGISKKGEVITFSTEEAIKHGYCEGKVNTIKDLLTKNNVKDYEVINFKLSQSEKISNIFLNPVISGLLLLIIVGGLYFELQTPGVGFPILASIIAAALYFIPYYLNGLAEYWELAFLVIGISLLMAEFFIIPGFGVAGVLGFLCTFGSLLLMMIDNDWFDFSKVQTNALSDSFITIGIGIIGGGLAIALALPQFLKSKRFKQISLQDVMDSEAGYTSTSYLDNFVGRQGVAHTVLRPSGKIRLGDELYDAASQGDFIEKGTKIIVISQEGTSLKVKKEED